MASRRSAGGHGLRALRALDARATKAGPSGVSARGVLEAALTFGRACARARPGGPAELRGKACSVGGEIVFARSAGASIGCARLSSMNLHQKLLGIPFVYDRVRPLVIGGLDCGVFYAGPARGPDDARCVSAGAEGRIS